MISESPSLPKSMSIIEEYSADVVSSILGQLPAHRPTVYETLLASVTGSTPSYQVKDIVIPNANRIFRKLKGHFISGVPHSHIYPLVFARAEFRWLTIHTSFMGRYIGESTSISRTSMMKCSKDFQPFRLVRQKKF